MSPSRRPRFERPRGAFRACLLVLWLALLVRWPLAAEKGAVADEHEPAAELATLQLAEGFEVNLFASEKEGVVKPIQIRFDARGRLWVIGSTVYPQIEPGQMPNDKVLVLEDLDGDGRSDRTTVFAEGLMIPTGLELGDGGVYLGHGTELLFLRDTDGDLRADERKVLLRGFGTGDNHQNINSFLFGPGGELWFCQGLHTHSNVETPWGIVRLNQAGLWRYRPRLKLLEGFYGSAHEPQNPWGYVFTDWGEPIVIAGNNSSSIYPVPGLTSSHLDLPPALIWKNGGGRKSSGADIVGTSHFPENWQGVVITGGYINNAVWALDLVEDGSGFEMRDRPPLIKSSSRAFRPVDVKFGPEGALYICDWYNPVIGHYQASFRDPSRDKSRGRIWRVTARGRPLTPRPQLAGRPASELAAQLESRDRWTRRFARRALSELPAETAAAAILEWAADETRSPRSLIEALGVLLGHEWVDDGFVRRLAWAREPGLRAFAANAVGRWAGQLPDPLDILRPLVADSNARVRLNAVVAASYIPREESLDLLAAASELPTDQFLDYALRQAVHALKPYWSPALHEGRLQLGRRPAHRALLLKTESAGEALGAVRSLLETPNAEPPEQLALWRTLIDFGGGEDLERLLGLRDPALVTALWPEAVRAVAQRKIAPPAQAAAALRAPVQARDPSALRLAGLWNVAEFHPALVTVSTEGTSPREARIAAVEGLGWSRNEAAGAVLARLSADPDEGVRAAAIVGLTHFDLAQAAQAARVASRAEAGFGAEAWRGVLRAFLQRQGGSAALAEAFASAPPAREIAFETIRYLNETGRRDEALVKALAPALESLEAHRWTAANLAELAAEVRDRGDRSRGEAIYRRPELGCVTCHAVRGEGGKIGPDLGSLGTAQSVEFVAGAILEPQKEVKEGFMSVSITTRDGTEYQGYLMREEGGRLVLNDVLQNRLVTVPKSEIERRQQAGSVMPAGLADTLTRAEFVDLVRYLSDLGR